MKILIIGPGAGDSFYCGNCFRDSLQTSALEKVLADKALYDSLREKAKAMARDRYSDRLCADKLIELYSGIIAQ